VIIWQLHQTYLISLDWGWRIDTIAVISFVILRGLWEIFDEFRLILFYLEQHLLLSRWLSYNMAQQGNTTDAAKQRPFELYAVAIGRKTGIFTNWNNCKQQVNGMSGNCYQRFHNLDDCVFVLDQNGATPKTDSEIAVYDVGNRSFPLSAYRNMLHRDADVIFNWITLKTITVLTVIPCQILYRRWDGMYPWRSGNKQLVTRSLREVIGISWPGFISDSIHVQLKASVRVW